MAKGKMPPELLEHFKKKNEGKTEDKDDKGAKAKESAEKGLKSARAAKKFKNKKKES
jgi:hypothetical protein